MKWERYGSTWRANSPRLGAVQIKRDGNRYYLLSNPWTGSGTVLGVYTSLAEAKEGANGRASNPGPRRHSKAWDDCVKDVKKKGTAVDPYAVCTAALGELSRRGSTRVKNPASAVFSALGDFVDVVAAGQILKSAERKPRKKRRVNPVWLKPYQFKKQR